MECIMGYLRRFAPREVGFGSGLVWFGSGGSTDLFFFVLQNFKNKHLLA